MTALTTTASGLPFNTSDFDTNSGFTITTPYAPFDGLGSFGLYQIPASVPPGYWRFHVIAPLTGVTDMAWVPQVILTFVRVHPSGGYASGVVTETTPIILANDTITNFTVEMDQIIQAEPGDQAFFTAQLVVNPPDGGSAVSYDFAASFKPIFEGHFLGYTGF